MSNVNLIYAWVVVDDAIKDYTTIDSKTVLLNKDAILKAYEKHETKKTSKNVAIQNCYIWGLDENSERYQKELQEMEQNGLMHIILDNR